MNKRTVTLGYAWTIRQAVSVQKALETFGPVTARKRASSFKASYADTMIGKRIETFKAIARRAEKELGIIVDIIE